MPARRTIDLFLVIVAGLLMTVARNPLLDPFSKQCHDRDGPGKPTMKVVKQGGKLERYKANGGMGAGDGVRARLAYRLPT
jgi:hypothetical protein